MAGIRVEGNTSGNVAEVNAANQLKVTAETAPLTNPGNVGAVKSYCEIDTGSVLGSVTLRSPGVSPNGRLRTSQDVILFSDSFNATTQNTSLWAYTFSTMTMSQPGAGYLNIGTAQGTLSGHGAFLRSFKYFPLAAEQNTVYRVVLGLFTATLVTNEEFRCGLGLPSAAGTAPTDGVWFVLDTAGLRGVHAFNGVVTQTAALATLASFTVGSYYALEIYITKRGAVEFWRDGVLLGTLAIPANEGAATIAQSHPAFVQKLCTGAVSNTNAIRVNDVTVYATDCVQNQAYTTILSCRGQDGNFGQNGQTQGQTSIYANSTAPTAVALSNTTAAFTGLGGQAAVNPTLTVSTDGIIFSYQNPASTINITGRNLLIYGVWLDSHVSVTFTGGPICYQYCLAYGHTAVSLATAETASFATGTTHAPRRVPLFTEVYAASAAAATKGAGRVYIQFRVPKVVRPGEFVAVTAKAGVGSTVTSAGALTFMCGFDSVWE